MNVLKHLNSVIINGLKGNYISFNATYITLKKRQMLQKKKKENKKGSVGHIAQLSSNALILAYFAIWPLVRITKK